VLFLECNWLGQRESLDFNVLLGDKWAPNGVMTNDIYLSLVTIRYDNGILY
jgi:hypothetical protein